MAQQVHHQIARQVPALEQGGRRAQRQEFLHGAVQCVYAINGVAQQQRRLVQIGRDHGGQREQLAHQHGCGFRGDQPVAAGGHHHGVQHHVAQLVSADGIGHHLHHFGRGQHADLDGICTNVLHHGVDLPAQDVHGNAVDAADTQRVLHGDGRDGRHAVAAQGAAGLEVGLYAGAATAVGARDDEHAGIALARGGSRFGGCGGRRGVVGSHGRKLSPMRMVNTGSCGMCCNAC